MNTKGTYSFQHQAIQDSVLISYSKINPKAIIPLLRLNHMIDIVHPQNHMEQADDIVIKIPKPYYHEFAKIILVLIDSICYDQSKLDRFMKSSIITENDEDLTYQLIACIHNRNDTVLWPRLLTTFRSYTHHYFPLYLLRSIGKLDKKMLTVNHTKDRMLISVTIADKHTSICIDPNLSIQIAFRSKYKDIIKRLLKNTDHVLLDFTNIFDETKPDRVLGNTKLLLENVKHNMIDMTQLFINVGFRTSVEEKPALDWIVDNVDNSLIDYHRCIEEMLVVYQNDIVLHILEKVNHRWLNINAIVKLCCEVGCSEIVEWVLENIDNELIDEEELINTTIDGYEKVNDCDYDDDDDVCKFCIGFIIILELFILEKPGILKYFDFNRLFGTASRKKCCGVLKLLFEHDSKLSINTDQIIEVVYKHFEEEEDEVNEEHCMKIVRLMMKYYLDIDVNKIIKKAVEIGLPNIVEKLLLDKVVNMHDIAHYLNITLDKLRRQQLNYSFVYFDRGRGKLLLLLLQRVNTKFIDLNSIMNDVCHIGHSSAVQWLLENKPKHTFIIRNIMNKACYHGDLKLVDYLFQKYSAADFEYKTAMLKACRNSKKQTLDVCKWLWAKIDRDLFDMKVALNNACRCDNIKVVTWILTDVDKGLFDTEAALVFACEHGNLNTVELLLDKSSINMIDFKYAITLACKNERSGFQITKLLYERADKSILDTNTIIADACKCFNNDIIQWIIETCDQNITVADKSDANPNLINNSDKNIIDMNRAINCIIDMDAPEKKTKNLDDTKYNLLCLILKQSDLRMIDLNKILTESCKKDWLVMFRFLLGKVNHALFNTREMINLACQCGAFDIVKWALENIDVKYLNVENVMVESCAYGWLDCLVLIQKHCNQYKFNVHTAMVEACTYGRINTAEWLLHNVKCQCFNLPLLLQEAGRNGWINIFCWLLRKVKFRTCDMHVATNEALANGHLHIVEMMLPVIGKKWLDLSSFSEKIYLDSMKEAVLKFLLHHFDPNLLDIATVMTKACTFGWKDTAVFIIDNDLSSQCDFTLAFNKACDNGETGIVKLLLEKVDRQILNVKKAMLSVAVKGWDEIAVLLLDKVEHTRLDIGNAFIEACRHGEIDIVQVILRKVDNNMLDIKTAFNKACENQMHEELVLWVLENIDQKQVDLKAVKKRSIRHKWWKVQFVLTKVDTEDLNQIEQDIETDCIVIS
ncbi:uncharacterized protein LOC127705288 [Mytilus californianus]|uniref:uncharacterized protein LOC127705288 n=1 Tax=Mytilus californianus TaxID=6549 RepID=UPI00224647C9|nr:uncharacterized protein LOC127705288 [Mytilus californianus]